MSILRIFLSCVAIEIHARRFSTWSLNWNTALSPIDVLFATKDKFMNSELCRVVAAPIISIFYAVQNIFPQLHKISFCSSRIRFRLKVFYVAEDIQLFVHININIWGSRRGRMKRYSNVVIQYCFILMTKPINSSRIEKKWKRYIMPLTFSA